MVVFIPFLIPFSTINVNTGMPKSFLFLVPEEIVPKYNCSSY